MTGVSEEVMGESGWPVLHRLHSPGIPATLELQEEALGSSQLCWSDLPLVWRLASGEAWRYAET